MPLRIGLLCLLLAFLIVIGRPVTPSPEALAVAGQYLAEKFPAYTFEAPRLGRLPSSAFTLTYATDYGETRAAVILTLSRHDGELAVDSSRLYIGDADPLRLARWSVMFVAVFGFVYLVFFVSLPHTFGRKCPRDLSLLKVTERVVIPGKVHRSGIGLAPIIERTYACRRCDFRHYEALSDPTYRPSVPSPYESARDIRARWEKKGLTDEDYERLLTEAKEDARARSSTDSPWLYR